MGNFRRGCIVFCASMAFALAAYAANLPTVQGPIDPSGIVGALNSLVGSINSGVGGLFNAQTGSAGNGADTTADQLQTIQVPNGFFTANGQVLRFMASGTFSATAATKTVRLSFGSIAVSNNGVAAVSTPWVLNLNVMKTGPNTQTYWGSYMDGTATLPFNGTGTVSESVGNSATLTGQSSVATANTVVSNAFIAEIIK